MSELMSSEVDFDWLADVYTRHGAINHPSELHGLLLGELAGGQSLGTDEWIALVMEHMGVEMLNDSKRPNLRADLQSFYRNVAGSIDQDSGSFVMLMPTEEFDLSERIEALALWVCGFLEGLALALGQKLNDTDADVAEIVRDFVQISQLDPRVAGKESDEREFFEICEFVKIGVLNIYAEFNQPSALNDTGHQNPTLH